MPRPDAVSGARRATSPNRRAWGSSVETAILGDCAALEGTRGHRPTPSANDLLQGCYGQKQETDANSALHSPFPQLAWSLPVPLDPGGSAQNCRTAQTGSSHCGWWGPLYRWRSGNDLRLRGKFFHTERLFVVLKPKLLTLPWFAFAWRWFVTVRDKLGYWLRRTWTRVRKADPAF